MSYFNTTAVSNEELKAFRVAARTQDEQVLAFFQRTGRGWTPSQVWQKLFQRSCPLTSVRRSITGLTKEGMLTKTDLQVSGFYGRPEYAWRISVGQGELFV